MTSPLRFSTLDEPFIRYRRVGDGTTVHATLPALFVAMAADEVRDFPALRPHQRHPWHAFLTQLAAIALHHAGRVELFDTADDWRAALLALTPDDADGAAWCLVSPADRPALLQAAVPGGRLDDWKSQYQAADELDMLVTSKNHDLKGSRALRADPDTWLFALVSLQTQEGFLGAGNYGISRMNGGFASRPGVGVAPIAAWGRHWCRDVSLLLTHREALTDRHGLRDQAGQALLWLLPWDGSSSLGFGSLDPYYIELCRRVRLRANGTTLTACSTGTKAARVAAKELNGVTGDPWTPIDVAAGKALTITGDGFHYKLVHELLFGGKFAPGVAQDMCASSVAGERIQLLARGVARGQGKTEGFHERRVPVSPKVRGLLASGQRDRLAQVSQQRIAAIGDVRKLLWLALATLFNNGQPASKDSDSVNNKARTFSQPFEQAEDTRFFTDLTEEIEADDPTANRLTWMIGLVERAETLLRHAFDAGPRSGMQRYRAQAAALSRFHGGLRGPKSPLPDLAHHYRQQALLRSPSALPEPPTEHAHAH
jgi:CRISPR system Cascade subunit CasA